MTKLIVISGFLGAGKTSTIASLGKMLISQGKKVGVITNDQGKNLVDTNFLNDEGMSVFEITEGCFCCNFDVFTKKLETMAKDQMPDVILAEPIGSAINLVTTIFKPVMSNYAKEFSVAPLSVVVDPKRVRRIMSDHQNNTNFGGEINYLFEQQLAEADVIALNKTDKLSEEEKEELIGFLKKRFSPAQVLAISAINGVGISEWFDVVSNKTAVDKPQREINYETHKKAEGNLAWLNSFVTLESNDPIDFNVILENLMNNISNQIAIENSEIAHLKAYAVSGYDFCKAGITSTGDIVGFNRKMDSKSKKANLILNARVEIDPAKLQEITEKALSDIYISNNLTPIDQKTESFAPKYTGPSCI